MEQHIASRVKKMSVETKTKQITFEKPRISTFAKVKNAVSTFYKLLTGEYFDGDYDIHDGDVERARAGQKSSVEDARVKGYLSQMNFK